MVMKSLYSEVGGRADIHNWGAPRCGRREISPHSMTMIQCLRRNMQNSKGMGIHINPSCFDVKTMGVARGPYPISIYGLNQKNVELNMKKNVSVSISLAIFIYILLQA